MRRLVALGAVAATALAGACGGSDAQPRQGTVAGIEVTGESDTDFEAGADLARYVERNCRGIERLSYPAFARSVGRGFPDIDAETYRRYLVRRYGNLFTAYGAALKRCVSFEAIRVSGGTVSIETSLNRIPANVVVAGDICDQLRASDVADGESGHEVVTAVGDRLRLCSQD